VEYALIELGASLFEPLSALCGRAGQHLGEVHAARARSHDGTD
jgi:DNA-binding HxlR family transcriptional regulator